MQWPGLSQQQSSQQTQTVTLWSSSSREKEPQQEDEKVNENNKQSHTQNLKKKKKKLVCCYGFILLHLLPAVLHVCVCVRVQTEAAVEPLSSLSLFPNKTMCVQIWFISISSSLLHFISVLFASISVAEVEAWIK